MRRYTWILTLTLAVACGDDKNTTTEATTGGSTTDATSTSSTSTSTTTPTSTDPSGTMGGSQTMGETTDATTLGPSTSTSGSTGEPGSTGSNTTGGGSADIPGACKAVCDKGVTECMIPEIGMTVDECTMGCVNDLGGAVDECAMATVAYLDCFAGLDCAALTDAIVNDNLGTCLDAAVHAGMVCDGGNTCTVGVNGGGTDCSVTIECPNMPIQEMQCMGKQCVCLVDGQKAGMCMANDICMTPDMLEQKAADCCGF